MKRKRNKGKHGGGNLAARQLAEIERRVARDGEVYGAVSIYNKLAAALGHKTLAARLSLKGIRFERAEHQNAPTYRYWNDESLARARKREAEAKAELMARTLMDDDIDAEPTLGDRLCESGTKGE